MVITTATESTSRELTREDISRERAELIARSGMTEEALRDAGANWELNADLRGVLSQINNLDFLTEHLPAA